MSLTMLPPPPFPRLPTKERERKRERGQSQLSDEQSSNKPCSVTHVGPIEILVYITAHRCCWAECILWVIRINTKWQHDSFTYKISLYFTVLWSQLKIFFLVCYFDSGSHSGSNPVLFGTVPYFIRNKIKVLNKLLHNYFVFRRNTTGNGNV